MRVIDARNGRLGKPLLLVDQIPPLEALRFRKVRVDHPTHPGHLYLAERDGYVALFFQLDPDPAPDPSHRWYGRGFEPIALPIRLDDGTAETLVDPLSPAADQVNRYFPDLAAIEVTVADDRRRFEDESLTWAAAITTRLWDEVRGRFPWIDKHVERDLLGARPTSPVRLAVEQIAELTYDALQRVARDPGGQSLDDMLGEVHAQVQAEIAAVPPRPGLALGPSAISPDAVVLDAVVLDMVEEYLMARRGWGLPAGLAGVWAVGQVVDEHATQAMAAAAVAEGDDVGADQARRQLWGRTQAARLAWAHHDTEPWLRHDVSSLLAAPPPPHLIPTEQARSNSTAQLHGWVEEALREERPSQREIDTAQTMAEGIWHRRGDERSVLEELRQRSAAANPGLQRTPQNRIDDQQRVVTDLDTRFRQAQETVTNLWAAREADRATRRTNRSRLVGRGVAAVRELQRREHGRLDDRVADPPTYLLAVLGQPPTDRGDQQAWREAAVRLERDRAAGFAGRTAANLDPAAAPHHEPGSRPDPSRCGGRGPGDPNWLGL